MSAAKKALLREENAVGAAWIEDQDAGLTLLTVEVHPTARIGQLITRLREREDVEDVRKRDSTHAEVVMNR